MTSSKKPLSSKVTFASLTQNNLGTVRKLNSVLFPIKYSEKFYSDILLPEVEDFCKLSVCQYVFPRLSAKPITPAVYYNDVPVGTICCRVETKDSTSHLYLLTMGVLAVRPDCSTAHRFGANSFLAIPISRHWFVYRRCHLEGCRYSYKTQNLSHISPRPSFKPGREAVLRTTWLQRKWHRRRLLQKNNTERRLGTRTKYSASGERAELTDCRCRPSIGTL
jgi:hypothetical protein